MFDRQRTSSNSEMGRAMALIELVDGRAVTGQVRLPLSGKLSEAMNNADQFLDVVTGDGKRQFIAKHRIQTASPVEVPKADQLQKRADLAVFDPYAVLGIPRGTAGDELKQAYHKMARAYHPDRLASLDLPKEMRDYAAAMLVRVNLAFEQLQG
ncbi:MAG: DnaJ domain-containing protein [Rhizobiales bacterium]|nr:DnaJ domain-containing protein [Hyphomicrobiales bacterium]